MADITSKGINETAQKVLCCFHRNKFSRSNVDISMADVMLKRVFVFKINETVLLSQKYVQKVKYGVVNEFV